MKKLLFAFALAVTGLGFTSCDEDEKIEVKDYGMKTFEADLKYQKDVEHGEVAYKQQTFMKLGEVAPIHVGTYGENTWTGFNMVQDPEHDEYNVTTDVTGWDLALTYYTAKQVDIGGGNMYTVAPTGALINTSAGIEVGLYEYSESKEVNKITEAFAGLSLTDVSSVEYENNIDVIGYGWKSVDTSTGLYTVFPNMFYIVKLANDETYKVRFISFHGETVEERIIKMEYALMQ